MSGTARLSAASAVSVIGTSMLLAVAWAPLQADDPVGTSVTFNREIIRIIQRKCESCHAPGGLSIPLSDYRDVRAWGRAIREELVEHRMPPAIVARGYGQYESDPGLNTREIATFLAWLDGGMPRGDEADRPAAPPAVHHHGAADGQTVTLRLPSQTVPAREELVVRRVTVNAGASAGRAIARVQLQPGNRRVIRGARVFAGGEVPQWIGAWLPWQHAIAPPASHAFQLPARGGVTVELYYRGAESEQIDESMIELSLAPEDARSRVADLVVEASAWKASLTRLVPQADARMRGSVQLRASTTIWAVYPALDASVKSMELRAERPDKSTEVLMWIPQVRAEWPLALVMREPVVLPAGSTVWLVAETDPTRVAAAAPRVTLSVLESRP